MDTPNIRVLNLTPGFTPFAKQDFQQIVVQEDSIWSGGEINIRFENYFLGDSQVLITTRLNNSNDIMRLLLATAYVRDMDAVKVSVFIPYLPYARQDRRCRPGEPDSLRIFADLLNTQKYDRVFFLDPHSYVADAVINRSAHFTNAPFIKAVIRKLREVPDRVFLVSPDHGSEKKVVALAEYFSDEPMNYINPGNVIYASKDRNQITGEIVGTRLNTGVDLTGKVVLITDDICDGGRSFYPLAQRLKEHGAERVVLAVTHGIFSYNFLDNYKRAGIDEVFTTDSIRSDNGSNAHTISIEGFLHYV